MQKCEKSNDVYVYILFTISLLTYACIYVIIKTTEKSRQQQGVTSTLLPTQVSEHLHDGNPRIDGRIILFYGLRRKGKSLDTPYPFESVVQE